MNHLNNYIFDLTVKSDRGNAETVGVTGFHKLFSENRGQWVATADLANHEVLNGLNGFITVNGLLRRKNAERVYNFTVEREHVYRVTTAAHWFIIIVSTMQKS